MTIYTELLDKGSLNELESPVFHNLPHHNQRSGTPLGSPATVVPVMKTRSGITEENIKLWMYETGTGITRDSCGTVLKTVAACNRHPGDHKPLLIPNSCGRASCPVCWETWAERAGGRVRDSLEGYLTLIHGNSQQPLPGLSKESVRARHITFSPPRSVIGRLVRETLQETDGPGFQRLFLRKFQRLAIDVVRSAGITAGILIVHDIRLKKGADSADRVIDTNRYREILDLSDWRDHVEFSPHVHVLGHGFVENYGDFYERTGGWIYKTIRVVDEPEKLMKYLLSHAPSVPNRCAYARFGRMHSRYMQKVKEYRCREYIACQECLEAGVPEDQATRVIAVLAEDAEGKPALQCEHDRDIDARYRSRGRGDPVSWAFETISNMKYSRVRHRCVYRRRDPGGPGGRGPGGPRSLGGRPPDSRIVSELGYARVNLDRFPYRDDRVVWVGAEKWKGLVQKGVISSWYEGVP